MARPRGLVPRLGRGAALGNQMEALQGGPSLAAAHQVTASTRITGGCGAGGRERGGTVGAGPGEKPDSLLSAGCSRLPWADASWGPADLGESPLLRTWAPTISSRFLVAFTNKSVSKVLPLPVTEATVLWSGHG